MEEREERKRCSDLCSSARWYGHQSGWVVWTAEVILSHQRKKPAVCLGPPSINQEPCKAAGKSNALCFIFQPESTGVGNRDCFFGEQASPAVCLQEAGRTPVPAIRPSDPAGELRPQTSQVLGGTPSWGTYCSSK